MRNRTRFSIARIAGIAAVALTSLVAAGPGFAQSSKPADKPMPAGEKAKEKEKAKEPKVIVTKAKPLEYTGFRAEYLHQLDDVQKKIVGLAHEIPADKFGWRPAPGVRSVGEVCTHIAGGTYFLSGLWGAKAPADVDVRNLDQRAADKDQAIDTVERSFLFLRLTIDQMPDADLDKSVDLFGRKGTTREAAFILANHLHEHLGQLIAYGRMNGVTPPWSKAEGK